VVHHWDVKALQIRNVPRNVEGLNLTLPIGQNLVAAKEALNEQAALRWPITFANDVFVGAKIFDRNRQAQHGLSLVLCQLGDAFQLSDEPV
jgi:hypothetical protein